LSLDCPATLLRSGAFSFSDPFGAAHADTRVRTTQDEVEETMARPDKAATVAELSERFTSSSGAVLTEYRGLTVKALKELRRSLGEDATYAVSKNTLTAIAARDAGVEGIGDLLVGPTAIAFIDGDPVVVAKSLRDFARTNPQLVVKGGVLDGKPLTPADVRQLADLESREVLLAKAAGAMKGVLAQAVSLFAAPLSKTARLVAALEQAATENPSMIAGAGAPAAEAGAVQATEAPAADAATDAAPAADETTTVAADAAEDK
jgi:large subunit ribosomal protein L10